MDILLFILVLGLNILIHEYAHFYFARKAGILCHEFAIGMGPAVYQKKKGETVYSVRLIPLGGYVSMAGEEVAAYIKEGSNVGINLDENGRVKEIVLNNSIKYDFIGRVMELDLYGLDGSELFIKLNVAGETETYEVNENAMYVFNEKKKMQLSVANRSYENKTLWERFKVVFAGPLSNFLLAFFILFIVGFIIGKPVNNTEVGATSDYANQMGISAGDYITKVDGTDVVNFDDISRIISKNLDDKVTIELNNEKLIDINLFIALQGLGITNVQGNHELVIGQVFGRSKDIKPNDIIKAIYMDDIILENDKSKALEVSSWNDLLTYVNSHSEEDKVLLVVEREGSNDLVNVIYDNISSKTLKKLDSGYIQYQIGVGGTSSFNFLYPFYYPFKQVGSDMKQMFNTIVLLIMPGSGVGPKDLAGPVGIFSLVSNARKQGFVSFLIFFAFLSVNVGFLNLMPIPALDGGRIVFIIYEAITKKKVNKNVENTIITITFILLLALMLFVTFQDITRLFR